MINEIGSEERKKILKSCEKLLFVRYQYARIALMYSYERIGSMEIAASAERLQVIIDAVIMAAKHYLDTGEDCAEIQRMSEETMVCSLSLLRLMQQLSRQNLAPSGIHPDDWEWIESVKANERTT